MRRTKILEKTEAEEKVIHGWLESTRRPSTARTYEYVSEEWIKWCRPQNINPLRPTRLAVDTWRNQLSRRHDDVTVKKKLSALSSMLTYGMSEHPDDVDDNPLIRIRYPRVSAESNREALDRDEANRLLDASFRYGSRAAAVIHILLWSGIRVAELRSAQADGFTIHNGQHRLTVKRKGGVREAVDVPVQAMTVVTAYLDGRDDGPLITGNHGSAISRYEVGRIVTQACAGITGKRITPHSLRHTFATLSLQAGADPLVIQKAMGHSSYATTQRYNHSVVRAGVTPSAALSEALGR